MSSKEKTALGAFLNAGGTIIATGPNGFYDERANPVAKTWLETFDVTVELDDPVRPGGFPPYGNFKKMEIAQCRVPESVQPQFRDGWLKVSVGPGELIWRPERITQKEIAGQTVKLLRDRDRATLRVGGLPADWRLRQFRDGNRWLIHVLPGHVEVALHPTLKNNFIDERIVEKVKFMPLTGPITLTSPTPLSRVMLHSPDLAQTSIGEANDRQKWSIDPKGVSRYFILEAMV